jgi:hypothetical protein
MASKPVPTSPSKWSKAKAEAKRKYKVYPSAYANSFAAKRYKEMGGSWKSKPKSKK